MKTTIEISDPLFEEARQAARRQGTTLRALVEQGLRLVLNERPQSPSITTPSSTRIEAARNPPA